METSLHRQLKTLYAGDSAACEVRVNGYRIDAIADGRLIEIQQASLGAIRSKIQRLLQRHHVLVVKPLAARKTIARIDRRTGAVVSLRRSPKAETLWDVFLDLVHFVDVFPHPRLTLGVVLVEMLDRRPVRRAAKQRWRDRDPSLDRELTAVLSTQRLTSTADLLALLPAELPTEFTTADLARVLALPRWWAQKIAYVLRKTSAIEAISRQQRSWVYRRTVAWAPPTSHRIRTRSAG